MLPSVNVGWLGTEYSGEGWLKLKDCLAFMIHISSCNLAIFGFVPLDYFGCLSLMLDH
jgi:hypothetical protein